MEQELSRAHFVVFQEGQGDKVRKEEEGLKQKVEELEEEKRKVEVALEQVARWTQLEEEKARLQGVKEDKQKMLVEVQGEGQGEVIGEDIHIQWT